MSIGSAVVLVGVGCYIIYCNSPAVQEKRRRRVQERIDKILEPVRKKKIKLNSSQNLLMKFLNYLIMRLHN